MHTLGEEPLDEPLSLAEQSPQPPHREAEVCVAEHGSQGGGGGRRCGREWWREQGVRYIKALFDMSMAAVTYLGGIELALDGPLIVSGYLVCFFTLLPYCPYLCQDLGRRRWVRAFFACLGAQKLFDYDGAVATPEVRLFEAIAGTVPMLVVAAAACGDHMDGLDIFFWGPEETLASDLVLLVSTLGSGVSISMAAGDCAKALHQRGELSLGVQLCSVLVHALDAVTLVLCLSSFGPSFSAAAIIIWLLVFWVLAGVVPLLMAPLPLPMLQAYADGSRACRLLYLFSASLLLPALPLTEYDALLLTTRRQRLGWTTVAALRTTFLIATFLIASALGTGWTDSSENALNLSIYLCALASAMLTYGACCRRLRLCCHTMEAEEASRGSATAVQDDSTAGDAQS